MLPEPLELWAPSPRATAGQFPAVLSMRYFNRLSGPAPTVSTRVPAQPRRAVSPPRRRTGPADVRPGALWALWALWARGSWTGGGDVGERNAAENKDR